MMSTWIHIQESSSQIRNNNHSLEMSEMQMSVRSSLQTLRNNLSRHRKLLGEGGNKKNTSGALNCCMTLTTTSRYAHRNRGINTGEMVTFDSSSPTKRTPSDHVGEWNQHMALNWSANDLTRMQFEDTVENHGGSMIFHVRGGRGVVDSITPSLHRKNFDGYTNCLWQTKKVTWKGKRPGTKLC